MLKRVQIHEEKELYFDKMEEAIASTTKFFYLLGDMQSLIESFLTKN